jgi:hypothetical protein
MGVMDLSQGRKPTLGDLIEREFGKILTSLTPSHLSPVSPNRLNPIRNREVGSSLMPMTKIRNLVTPQNNPTKPMVSEP